MYIYIYIYIPPFLLGSIIPVAIGISPLLFNLQNRIIWTSEMRRERVIKSLFLIAKIGFWEHEAFILAKPLNGQGWRSSLASSFSQDGPKMAPRWPKMASSWPKMAPRWPQDGPRWPKMAPRWPQDGPRCPHMAQDGFNLAQKGSQKSPKWAKMAPKMA